MMNIGVKEKGWGVNEIMSFMVWATEYVCVGVFHEIQDNERSPGLEGKACARGFWWKIENSRFKGAEPELISFLKAL